MASYFQLAPNHPLGSFFQTIGTQSLASLRKTAALPPGTQRFRTPTLNGGALASYFQIARTTPWVRFFRPSKPANFGFVAQNRLIASRPPTIQSPDRIGRGLGFVFSNRPNHPLGSFFQAIETRKLWLRCEKTQHGPLRLQNPDHAGGAFALSSYFQLNRPESAIGFVFSNHPNPQTLASFRKTAARPAGTRPLQNPNHAGGAFAFVPISTQPSPNQPLGSFFQTNGTRRLWLRRAKTPFLRLPVPFPHHTPLLPSSSRIISRPALR